MLTCKIRHKNVPLSRHWPHFSTLRTIWPYSGVIKEQWSTVKPFLWRGVNETLISRSWLPDYLVPLLVQCVLCSKFTPTVFSYNWVAFLKSCSSFDFEQWKKRSQRRREIVIDGRSFCHSWQCFQLAFLVTWKATFSAQSEQVSTNVPFLQSAY